MNVDVIIRWRNQKPSRIDRIALTRKRYRHRSHARQNLIKVAAAAANVQDDKERGGNVGVEFVDHLLQRVHTPRRTADGYYGEAANLRLVVTSKDIAHPIHS